MSILCPHSLYWVRRGGRARSALSRIAAIKGSIIWQAYQTQHMHLSKFHHRVVTDRPQQLEGHWVMVSWWQHSI